MLHLRYDDKYALWNDLIHKGTSRLFIETEQTALIGAMVPLEVRSEANKLPILLSAEVVGRRLESRRFPAGLFIRISSLELEKCRRFLGLEPPEAAYQRARRAVRVHTEVRVRLQGPAGTEHGLTRNLSATGAYIVSPLVTQPGERVRIVLELPAGDVELEADVQWVFRNGEGAIGVQLVDLSVADRARLETHINMTLLRQEQGAEERPAPVVVADDEPAIVDMLVTALSKHGFEVYEARTGKDAITLIRQLNPRLVLLDILMPGLDGVDICKTMRGDAELFETPVIFISALDEDALAQVADEAGASDYLAKPLALAELLNLVGEYLRGGS